MKKLITVLLAAVLLFAAAPALGEEAPIDIKVLILPKFENGELSGDFPGEAQLYYEAYLMGGEEYEIYGAYGENKLYVKDGVALYVTGVGKVNAAVTLTSVVLDDRFDFSDAYIFSTGCAGSAYGSTVMGDVFVITATADADLGHTADARDMADPEAITFFPDPSYSHTGYKALNTELTDKIYEMVKDVKLETTPKTRNFMAVTFENADWAIRDPQVLRGTGVTADNYWKGMYSHNNAEFICEYYGAADPYAVTEMEDNAIAVAADRLGMLDRLIIIRDSVNMDVFMNGATPESLWDPEFDFSLATEENVEAADIFKTARYNNFNVGKIVIDAILSGEL